MKKMKMFTVAFIASLFIVSCTKDESPAATVTPTSQELISTEWLKPKWGYIYPSGNEVLYDYSVRCESNKDYLQVTNDGKFKEKYSAKDCKTYSEYSGNWSLTDKKLTVSYADFFDGYTNWEIIELTDKVLKIKAPYNRSIVKKMSSNLALVKEEVPVSFVLVFNRK